MKGSIVIFGSTKEKLHVRAAEILKNHELDFNANNPDVFLVEVPENKKSIGIAEIKTGIKWLETRPFSHDRKALLITGAEKMTTEAQNSLLKTLEEPPAYATIILLAKTLDTLLPTVISRCQRVEVHRQGRENTTPDTGTISLNSFLKMSVGERLDWATATAKEEREDVIEILERWIGEFHNNMSDGLIMGDSLNFSKRLLEVYNDLNKTNVNLRLALEYLCLH
jgi:hypothetical protein